MLAIGVPEDATGPTTKLWNTSDVNEQRIHKVFQISVLLKGAHALTECVAGIALAFVSTDTVAKVVDAITQEELRRDPTDFVARHLLNAATNLSISTEHFYAFYLLSHGVIKICLVAALLRNKLWAYPVSLIVLALFIAYQIYRYIHTHGAGLLVLTVFDIFIMWLIWHEYQARRQPHSHLKT